MSAMSVVAVTLLAGCSINNIGEAFDGFGWPQGGITVQSERMYDLWIGSVVAALAVGVFVWGLIFWCVAAYRRKRGDVDLPTQTRFNLPIEILYTVLPFLVISVLFYYTAVIQTDVDKLSDDPAATVEVQAFKWNWQFNYLSDPGPDAERVESTPGDSNYIPIVVVPVGQTVRFVEHSSDVIHSFWVPELLFKRDVFPGNVVNQFEVTVKQEGSYVGRCAELCGTYHSMMNFELRAVSPERYQQYVAALKSGKNTPQALAAIGYSGADLYATTTEPFPTVRDAN
ncbi:cytochrome c oxidase subunit II [Catellatospora sp. NPDC049609]|uniref:aa3-type cytochrome oxidase subunit II n=1 Tax=Catellatospora sp. NPDC049609 TaxID=3155505 RepID=UPI003444F8DA